LITNVKSAAIPTKKEFATLAPSRRFCRRRDHSDHWNSDVGCAGTRHYFYTAWSGHSGERISMGEKVALDSPSMAARPFSKSQIEKAR
jgi:hypothetical protein